MINSSDSVRIVLFKAKDLVEFLILCEADDPSNWKLPGGKLESGEEPTAAAIRELGEELGVEINIEALTTVRELTNDDGSSKRFIFCAMIGSEQVNPTSEIASIRWINEKSIPTGQNSHHIQSALQAARIKLASSRK